MQQLSLLPHSRPQGSESKANSFGASASGNEFGAALEKAGATGTYGASDDSVDRVDAKNTAKNTPDIAQRTAVNGDQRRESTGQTVDKHGDMQEGEYGQYSPQQQQVLPHQQTQSVESAEHLEALGKVVGQNALNAEPVVGVGIAYSNLMANGATGAGDLMAEPTGLRTAEQSLNSFSGSSSDSSSGTPLHSALNSRLGSQVNSQLAASDGVTVVATSAPQSGAASAHIFGSGGADTGAMTSQKNYALSVNGVPVNGPAGTNANGTQSLLGASGEAGTATNNVASEVAAVINGQSPQNSNLNAGARGIVGDQVTSFGANTDGKLANAISHGPITDGSDAVSLGRGMRSASVDAVQSPTGVNGARVITQDQVTGQSGNLGLDGATFEGLSPQVKSTISGAAQDGSAASMANNAGTHLDSAAIAAKVADANILSDVPEVKVDANSGLKFVDGRLTETASTKPYVSSLPLPVSDGEWSDQLSQKMMWMSARNIQAAELHLNPADMGPIEIRIQIGADQSSINFNTQNQTVRELLEANIHRLRDMLNSADQEGGGGSAGDSSGSSADSSTDSDANQTASMVDSGDVFGDDMSRDADDTAPPSSLMPVGDGRSVDAYA